MSITTFAKNKIRHFIIAISALGAAYAVSLVAAGCASTAHSQSTTANCRVRVPFTSPSSCLVPTGRVVQRGQDLHISIELDDLDSGKQVWGQQYARKVSEMLEVQNDIAREVSQKLRSQLSEVERQKMTLGSTTNPEAYQLYLKGEFYTDKFTKEGFRKGVDYLNQAVALDPNYSRAYGALAYNYINQDDWFINPREAAPKARAAALKASSLDETETGAHVALAIEDQWYEWDWVAAEREFKRAIELDPEDGGTPGVLLVVFAADAAQ